MKDILHSTNCISSTNFNRIMNLRFVFLVTLSIASILIVGCSAPQKTIKPFADDAKGASSAGFNKNTKYFNSDIKINEKDEKKYQVALMMMMEDTNYQGAMELFKQVSLDYPELSGPYINMGIISVKQNNYLQAEGYFQQASIHRPDNAEVYNYLGVVYRQQGRFSDAGKAYKKALELDGAMAKTYLNLGILNDLYLGNYVEAERNYKKYQQLDPENKKVNAWLLDLNSRKQASVE